MASEPQHLPITYNEVHNLVRRSAKEIAEFNPNLIVAIGRGFFPARLLRTFLRDPSTRGNIPVLAVGLSLYEKVPGLVAEQIGSQIIKTQWLGPEARQRLVGKRVLVVDEIDDSRKTLQYAIAELQKDVDEATQFAVFVVHNKLKPKIGMLPADVTYYAGEEVGDLWLDYPWEVIDIEEHDRLALAQRGV
ncbi:phosphoribosyltransferase-like protein [Russula brevipes]|nr:phosphoribosyltransferase-like protein [Russula brevipes]